MKSWLKISLWSLFALAVCVLMYFVHDTLQNMSLKKRDVLIHTDSESAFLSESELISRLERKGLVYVNQRVKDLNTEEIERYVREMEEVKNVEIFSYLNGTWKIELDLREPIARIFNKYGETYYLDADGQTISASSDHTARVLVVTGDIPDRFDSESVDVIINNDSLKTIRKLDDVYRISKYVCKDPLLRSLIGQIHRESNGDFVLIPLVGDQKIIFGSAFTEEEVADKFKKLMIFYKEAIPYEGWNKYSEVSLKYEKQIVCKKKQ